MTSNDHVVISMPLDTALNGCQGLSEYSASYNQGIRSFDMYNPNYRPNEQTTQSTGNSLLYQNHNTKISTRHFCEQPLSEENEQIQMLSQLNFPPYNDNDIQRWLIHIEFLFKSNNITLSSVKYRAIIKLLPTEILWELPYNIQFDPKAFEKIREIIVNKIALSDRQREQMLSANKIGLENQKQFINNWDDPYAGMNLNTFSNFANPAYHPAHSAISPVRQIEVAQMQESIQALIKEVHDLHIEVNDLKKLRETQSKSYRWFNRCDRNSNGSTRNINSPNIITADPILTKSSLKSLQPKNPNYKPKNIKINGFVHCTDYSNSQIMNNKYIPLNSSYNMCMYQNNPSMLNTSANVCAVSSQEYVNKPPSLIKINCVRNRICFIWDTGAMCSILKATDEDRKNATIGHFLAANNTSINVYGKKTLKIDFGIRRSYEHTFYIADTKFDILGIDFLTKHKFIIDFNTKNIIDGVTKIQLPFPQELECCEDIALLHTVTYKTNLPSCSSDYTELLENYSHVFSEDDNCEIQEIISNNTQHDSMGLNELELKALEEVQPYKIYVEGPPINIKSRRIPTKLYKDAQDEIHSLLAKGVLVPSRSEWGFPISVLKKQNGGTRIVADLRLLNNRTKRDNYNISHINDFINILHGRKIFSVLDIRKAFYSLKLASECYKYLTINTPFGSYSYTRIVEGLHASPSAFSKYINIILSRIENIYVYVDDVIVATRSPEEHRQTLEKIFHRLSLFGLKLNPDKCVIAKEKVTYLGFDIEQNSLLPNKERTEAISQIPKPKNIKQLRGFIGSLNYFKSSIPGLTQILVPLLAYLKGSPYSQKKVRWNSEAEQAFEKAKQALQLAVPLTFPSSEALLSLYTDASDKAIAGVLIASENGINKPLGFYSTSLSNSECNYSIFSKELLAIVKSLKKFTHFIEGRSVQVYCDNLSVVQSVKKTTDSKNLVCREQRYLSYLSEYELTFTHISSAENILADFLSRYNNDDNVSTTTTTTNNNNNENQVSEALNINMIQDNEENEFDTLSFISAIFKTSAADIFRKFNQFNYKKLCEEQMKDDFLKSILQNPDESSLDVSKRKVTHDNEEIELAMDVSKPQYSRIIVPNSMVTEFIQHFHALGHLGIKKTLSKLKKVAVWPSMRKAIREFISSCDPCLRTKMYKNISPPYEKFAPVGHKFEVVHLDILKLPEVKGYKYLLTLIDRYSRYPYAYPLKNIEAKTITDTLVKEFLPMAGVVNTFVTDRGAQFSSEIFGAVCENLGSNHRYTMAQCPQSNGLIENFHKTLLSTFRTMLTEICNTSWLELLPFSLICLRTAPFDNFGISPTLLMYGQNIRIPGALIEPPNIPWPMAHQTYAEKLQTFSPCHYLPNLNQGMQKFMCQSH